MKVDAVYAAYEEFGGRLQPQVYRDLWMTRVRRDAAVRAVGTLTRAGGDTVVDSGALKARIAPAPPTEDEQRTFVMRH